MGKIIIILCEMLLAIVLMLIGKFNNIPLLENIGLIFLGLFFGSILELLKTNYGMICIFFRSLFLKRLRLSFAYLIRVKVGNDYLLVKSKRFDLFQPPGGVFVLNRFSVCEELNLISDENMKKVAENDLRKILTKPYRVLEVINWFHSQRDRETSPHREFIEELIDSGILPKEKFKSLSFSYIKRINTGIEYSEHFKCHELKIFEIFEFIPDSEQQDILFDAKSHGSDKIIFMDSKAIDRSGYCNHTGKSFNLGSQTKYLI